MPHAEVTPVCDCRRSGKRDLSGNPIRINDGDLLMADINGHCDERFESVRRAFAANLDTGRDLGATLAVTHHGKLVVDLYGGFADRQQTVPWQAETIANVFSTTKNALVSGLGDQFSAVTSIKTPNKNAPAILTIKVPQGNASPKWCAKEPARDMSV